MQRPGVVPLNAAGIPWERGMVAFIRVQRRSISVPGPPEKHPEATLPPFSSTGPRSRAPAGGLDEAGVGGAAVPS